MTDDEADEEWRPSCYDCEREFSSTAALVTHPVHIEYEDRSGYEVVPVPLCPACRRARMHTYECEVCGEEYVDLDRAVECCAHIPEGVRP